MIGKGITYALLTALCFGIMPILTKLVYGATGVDPFFFLMVRYTIAAILIWGYLYWRRDKSYKQINHTDFFLVLATSCCYIVVTSAYFIALQYIDASLNSLLVFTFPVFTPFLGLLFFKEKLHLAQIMAAIVGFAGCALLIGNYHLKGVPGEMLGIGLGLLSGILYSLYTIFGQKMTVRLEPLTITALSLTMVALFFLVTRISWLWQHPQPLQVYFVAGIIALISTVLANTFYFKAIKAIGAVKAGIFSSLEPFFTAILAIFFLGERMGLWQWFGGLLILCGMILVQQTWAGKTKDLVSNEVR